ncbi:MAG: copper resistance protein CopC [Actinomycetota bacterium]
MHAVLAAVAATLLLPAHASVIGSTPQDGSIVTEQPGSFSVVLNEEIIDVPGAASANALQVTDAAGLYYGAGCGVVDGDTISLDAQLGAAGDYTVTYQVVSADGHPVSGEIGFAFEPVDGVGGPDGSASAPECAGAAPAVPEPSTEPAPAAPTTSAPATTEPAATEPAATESEEPATDAPEATASSDQGAPIESEAPAEETGGQLPFLAIGVLAVLAVLAVIAYRANRLRKDRAADEL